MTMLIGPVAYAVTSLSDPLAARGETLADAAVTSRATSMTPPRGSRRHGVARRLRVFLHHPTLATGELR